MHPADLELKARALIKVLSIRDMIVCFGSIIFLGWTWVDLIPALEHIALSIRTAFIDDVSDQVMIRLSQTLIPFGLICSKLMATTLLCYGLIYLINRAEWFENDWDQNIKTLKKERKQKTKRIEAEIARLDHLSEKGLIITAAAKDIEILADKVERLKLEVSKPRKTKAEPDKAKPKTAELFVTNVKPSPRPNRAPQRPEF